MATYEAKQGTLTAVASGKTSSVGGYSASASDTYLYSGSGTTFKLYRRVNHFGDTSYYNLVTPAHNDRVICTPTSGDKTVVTYTEGGKAWAAATTSEVQGRAVKYVAAGFNSGYNVGKYNNRNVLVKSLTSAPTSAEPEYIFNTTANSLALYRLIAATFEDATSDDYSYYYEKIEPSVNTVIAVGSSTTATSYIYKKTAGSWA